MQTTGTFRLARRTLSGGRLTFNVVIAYEDFDTGKHARKTYESLIEQLPDAGEFSNQMWKFDVLAVPKLRDMAAKDAAQADIIIVAAHGTGELPPEVKAWAESWMDRPTRAIALVGLFGAGEYLDNPARTYLARVARRAGIEFFAQPALWPGPEPAAAHPFGSMERNGRAYSVLADVVQQSQDGWGVND